MTIARTTLFIACLALLNFGCLSTGNNQRPSHSVDPSKPPELSDISARVTAAYQKLERYSFDALLHRQWTEDGHTVERENFAVVKMGIDTILTRVFDSAGPDKRMIAVATKKKGEAGRLPMDRREDGCLSGTLQEPWIGPTPTDHVLLLAKRIKAGRYAGTEQVNGRTCHVIKHDILMDEGEHYYRRVDTYYIDAKTFRMAVWKNEDYEKLTGKPRMTCTRSYTEREVSERASSDSR